MCSSLVLEVVMLLAKRVFPSMSANACFSCIILFDYISRIIKNLNLSPVVIISMDSFYKVLSPENSSRAFLNGYNFDHPDILIFNKNINQV
jgi:hypothetical protein